MTNTSAFIKRVSRNGAYFAWSFAALVIICAASRAMGGEPEQSSLNVYITSRDHGNAGKFDIKKTLLSNEEGQLTTLLSDRQLRCLSYQIVALSKSRVYQKGKLSTLDIVLDVYKTGTKMTHSESPARLSNDGKEIHVEVEVRDSGDSCSIVSASAINLELERSKVTQSIEQNAIKEALQKLGSSSEGIVAKDSEPRLADGRPAAKTLVEEGRPSSASPEMEGHSNSARQ